MKSDPEDMVIAVMPEGPIAFDGKDYRYSKGERLYLDNLASHFGQLLLVCFVLREGDEAYETCLHSPFEAENLTVIELPRGGSGQTGVAGKAIQFAKVFFLLLKIAPKADLLYLFLPSYPSAMGWLAAKIRRKPHIVYGADDWEQASASMFKWESLRGGWFYRLYAWLNRKMERAIVRSARFGVAAGGQLRDKYTGFGCPTYDTTPRMTLTREDIFEREDSCRNETITLINVGALIHDKAQHVLIEAFALAARQNERLRLMIVGDGPRRDELKALAEDLGVAGKIDFAGYVEEEARLYALLRAADIFVLSSVTEGFPRVLYESMTMRLPIVTTNVGGIPNLLTDRVNARVVRPEDVQALAAAIADVATDQELRRGMIKAATTTMDGVFERMNPAQIAHLVRQYQTGSGTTGAKI